MPGHGPKKDPHRHNWYETGTNKDGTISYQRCDCGALRDVPK